jgi:hypothetical protein
VVYCLCCICILLEFGSLLFLNVLQDVKHPVCSSSFLTFSNVPWQIWTRFALYFLYCILYNSGVDR